GRSTGSSKAGSSSSIGASPAPTPSRGASVVAGCTPTSASSTAPSPWARSPTDACRSGPGDDVSDHAADPPLHGLRVVGLSTVVAGPACARYLADFGANVIKVERPDGGDTLRDMGWRDPRDDVTLWWKLGGRGKRSIALDLKAAADLDVMHRLCADADVLIENFRPGTLERLGLGPDVLLAARPSLVITRITGFGQDGPYAGRPGFA